MPDFGASRLREICLASRFRINTIGVLDIINQYSIKNATPNGMAFLLNIYVPLITFHKPVLEIFSITTLEIEEVNS